METVEISTPKRNLKKTNGKSLIHKFVRRTLVWLEGSDYQERYLKLSKQFALSDLIGQQGQFKCYRGHWHNCTITGVVVRQYGGDILIIDYTAKDGDIVEGAEISRNGFRAM